MEGCACIHTHLVEDPEGACQEISLNHLAAHALVTAQGRTARLLGALALQRVRVRAHERGPLRGHVLQHEREARRAQSGCVLSEASGLFIPLLRLRHAVGRGAALADNPWVL